MKMNRHTTSDRWEAARSVTRHVSRAAQSAFSLIEILIVMSLLSVITIGLMAMFGQVQKAFLSSVTQTDVLESGRATTELLSRELAGNIPSYQGGAVNFFADIPSAGSVSYQSLPGIASDQRANILGRLYFLSRENQKWTGYAYQVEDDGSGVGTLYRSLVTADVSTPPQNLFPVFPATPSTSAAWHRVMDGVVEFRVRAYDADGRWITGNLTNNAGLLKSDIRFGNVVPGEVGLYIFSSNAVPAYVEIELGILEKRANQKIKALPTPAARQNYLKSQAGKTHVFRQRVPVRMVDVTAYQ
jgi:prepilin-type N-terminal cleavage/methylation domain-containing protein